MELAGRVALVTGGGSGLGAAAAVRLACEGADVAILCVMEDVLNQGAHQIEAQGRRALVIVSSTDSAPAMAEAFEKLRHAFGRLDVLFANAGVNGTWAPLDQLTVDEWDKTIEINLRGTFLSLHHAVPLMRERGGSIIITSSINGTRTFTTAGASAYSTTKAGQLALGQMLALELAKYKIRVNVICPGAIGTEISDNTKKRATARAKVPAKYPKGTVPLTDGAAGTAREVAELALFLAGSRSRHLSGTPIWIDGAQSLLV